jgi:hypothetical protein
MAENVRRVVKLQDFADTLATIGGGWRTTFVYLNTASFKKTGQAVDMDAFGSALDNDNELEQGVSTNFRNFVAGGATRKNRFPYAGVVKVAKYTVNWQTAKKHKEHYDDFVNKSDELSARYAAQALKRQGLPLTQDALDSVQIKSRAQRDFEKQENGQEVKPRKDARRLVDYGQGGMYIRTNDFDKNGNNRVVIPQNMKTVTPGGTHYYLIGDDGSIAGGKPVSFETLKHVLSISPKNPERGSKADALRKLGADDNEIAAYLKEFGELGWSENDFMADMFLYAVASCEDGYKNGMPSKVIFFNEELIDEIVSGKDAVKINPSQFLALAKKEINSTYGIALEVKRYINSWCKKMISEAYNKHQTNMLIESVIRRCVNEAIDPVAKIQEFIQQANAAYHNALEVQDNDEWPLMDKEGTPYGLKGDIKLDGRGYIIIPFTSGAYGGYEPVKIRVLTKAGGRIRIIQGDYMEEGWKDARKMLKQIIRDAQTGNGYFQNYDPNWESADTPEEYKANKAALRNMNKQIGMKANSGMDYISKNY